MIWIVLLVLLARLRFSDAGEAMVLTGDLPSTYSGGLKFENGRYVAVLNNIYQLSELLVVKEREMRFSIQMNGAESDAWWRIKWGFTNGDTKELLIVEVGLAVVSFIDEHGSFDVTRHPMFLDFIMSHEGDIKSVNGRSVSPPVPGYMRMMLPDKPTAPGMYGFSMSFPDNPDMVIKVYFDPGYIGTMNY